MNIENLKLMQTMLGEVTAGTWVASEGATYYSQPLDGKVQFNLRSWFDDMTDGCGYSACAIGHAVMDDRFIKLGWSLDVFAPRYMNPVNGTHLTGWDAVETFFGIEQLTAQYLFMERRYLYKSIEPVKTTPAMVNARIETLIQFGEQEFRDRGVYQ